MNDLENISPDTFKDLPPEVLEDLYNFFQGLIDNYTNLRNLVNQERIRKHNYRMARDYGILTDIRDLEK